jgi:hypothetical protein
MLGLCGGVLQTNCSSSTTSGLGHRRDGGTPECEPGVTRICVGPGACTGGQKCSRDSFWEDCDCGVSTVATGGGTGNGGATGDGGSTNGGTGNGGTSGGTGGTTGCFAVDLNYEPLPADVYVMFDQSQSMSTAVANSNPPMTWWTAAQQAFTDFVQDPVAAGLGVGIQFFPYKGTVEGPDPNQPSSSCYVPNYETPEVEIGMLPGNNVALIAAVGAHAPTTFTPTAAALQGALQHMQKWAPAHPGRQAAVVLVTDGFPTECDPQDTALIAQIAEAAFEGSPRVLTYVIGLEDAGAGSLTNLTQIARAGGTGAALLISGGDIGRQFVQALLSVGRSPAACEFALPPQTTPPLDVSQLWMQYEPQGSGAPEVIPGVPTLADCASSNDGWYLDAPTAPTKILMCPQTCRRFATGSVTVAYGCKPTSP